MREYSGVSMAVIRRLPKYHRYLKDLLNKEIYRISSKELGKLIGFTASQIRQDLNCFGGFGQQGYGYNVEELYNEIGKILGLNKTYTTVIIGAGNLGQAIANYPSFKKYGFQLLGLFDTNPKLTGIKIRDIDVYDMDDLEEFVLKNNVEIGIICTPKEVAQDVADILCRSGIKGIWNFAPIDLKISNEVIVENVHLSESLFILSFLLNDKGNKS